MASPRADCVLCISGELIVIGTQWRQDVRAVQLGKTCSARDVHRHFSPTLRQVPPAYFTLDDGRYSLGGGWGFLTEGGPGENPMSVDSLKVKLAMCSSLRQSLYSPLSKCMQHTVDSDDLWPPLPNDCWGHCGSELGLFGGLKRFNLPLTARCSSSASSIVLDSSSFLMLGTGRRCRCQTTLARLPPPLLRATEHLLKGTAKTSAFTKFFCF